MSPDEARELLSFHCGANPNVDDPRWQNGFLSMLRPYKGLREPVFHQVMDCVVALADELRGERIDRGAISSLWGICHLGRAWGLEEGGMLRRNGLITDEDRSRLAEWIDCISYAVMMLLDGSTLEEALEPYRILQAEQSKQER
jgi:hypothetical protein